MGKVDILNRNEYVEKLFNLIQNVSEAKTTTCFAINGTWGCGKSFVLDMLEERLNVVQSEETSSDRYFVVRYNCWKYDYYEEPLVAIVATMISAIEEKTKLFPDSDTRHRVLGMLKATGVALLSIANTAIKEETGIDVQTAFAAVCDATKENESTYRFAHEYDMYFSFKLVMKKLSNLLEKISKDYTLVFIVDELDRCTPEYAIKVLERLHHLTENQSNTVTLLAIDKLQLVSSVKQLFGFDNPEKYLEKFISFEIKLDKGTVSSLITEKYADYIKLFDKDIFQFDDAVEECLQAIFKDIDIRTQEQIVNKAIIVHKLLFTEKRDYSFMCMELLTAVMICVYKYQRFWDGSLFSGSDFGRIFDLGTNNQMPAFSELFKEKFNSIRFSRVMSISDEKSNLCLPSEPSLYGAILFTWCWMHKNRRVNYQHTRGDAYTPIIENYKDLQKFAETINIMQ